MEVGLPSINLGEGNTDIQSLALCKRFSNAGQPRGLFLQGLYLPSAALHTGSKKISFLSVVEHNMGFPHSWGGKESACNAGDLGSIPGSGRSLGEGHGNPLQYSCLENPMDRGAWWATVHGVTKVGHDLETKPPPPRHNMGFPSDSAGKEPACDAGDTGDVGSAPQVGKIPWRRKWQPTPVVLPEKYHGQ